MSVYPSETVIDQGTIDTEVNPENWNQLVDNINALIDDLIEAHGDGSDFPGVDHSSAQSVCVADAMGAIRHQLVHLSGETYYYTAPSGSLKVHTHAVGQGGLVPWGSLGTSNARKVELHPAYPGGIIVNTLRGATASGNNTITTVIGENVISSVGRHVYFGSSAQAALNDTYIALRFTLPVDFAAWASANAIQIEYRTLSELSSDCHVDVYVYKSGNGTVIINSDNNVNVHWSNIGIGSANLGAWSAGDILEIYIKLESRNDNYAMVGKIALNYNS